MVLAIFDTERSDENVLNHIRGRFRPTLVFVGAKLDRTGAIDEPIVAIEMRCRDSPHQEGHGKGLG
jgi:hypothetical protein